MRKQIQLISTTSSIEGWTIEKYFGIVTYQLVVGANIFKDVFASFRDIFGGSAKGYQKDLQKMENIALENLKENALKKGGNIILGLRLDFDEISGNGKSMFMLSASGTVALGSSESAKDLIESEEVIEFDKLEFEIEKEELENKVCSKSYKLRSYKVISKMLKYNIYTINKLMDYMNYYNLDSYNSYDGYSENKDLISSYFNNFSFEEINQYLMSNQINKISYNTFNVLIELLEGIGWFNYDVMVSLLNSNNPKSYSRVLSLLELEKPYYSFKDIQLLENLRNNINSSSKTYPIISTIKGTFGKAKEVWICPKCEHKNNKEDSLCNCGANIFGTLNTPEKIIQYLTKKTDKLKQLLQ